MKPDLGGVGAQAAGTAPERPHHLTRGRYVDELVAAGHALSQAGLVTAFGHVSCRVADDRLLITPPMPLGRLTPESAWTELYLDADTLAAGVPREAWIHLTIARRRRDVGAICRAQPPTATALASAGVPIVPLHGQGAFLGSCVPVFDDAVLIRDRARAEALADRLGQEPALLLRGNGAVTVGADVGEAVARMWVLEASARMNFVAAAAGTPNPLSDDEQAAWRDVAPELLGRIWRDLRQAGAHPARSGEEGTS
jgi:HCOMODA/2-hydroxy-3-carboxy-muconic semialdehyde decarboxylase